VFTAFEKEFEGKIVFFGERGDRLWDKNSQDVNNFFRFSDEIYNGTSMIEHRLRVGYIYLPLPIYGAQNWESIHCISNSTEMEEYSVNGDYDRPIPRKIIEDKGISRNEFGKEKKGAGFNYRFDNLSRLRKRMSDNSYDSFYSFYKEKNIVSFNRLLANIKYIWNTKHIYIDYALRKIGYTHKYKRLHADSVSNPGPLSFL